MGKRRFKIRRSYYREGGNLQKNRVQKTDTKLVKGNKLGEGTSEDRAFNLGNKVLPVLRACPDCPLWSVFYFCTMQCRSGTHCLLCIFPEASQWAAVILVWNKQLFQGVVTSSYKRLNQEMNKVFYTKFTSVTETHSITSSLLLVVKLKILGCVLQKHLVQRSAKQTPDCHYKMRLFET